MSESTGNGHGKGRMQGDGATQPDPALAQPANIFADLSQFRISETDLMPGLIEHLAHVPVRKPNKQEFFRAHPDPAMSMATSVFLDTEERETYIAMPDIRPLLADLLKPVLLAACITRQKVLLLWPIALPDTTGSGGNRAWGETARQAAELAKKHWVRIHADMAYGGYRIVQAAGELSEPEWPDKSLSELLGVAFKDRLITSADHPVVRKLRGLS
jgi:hypothetical protein